MIKQILSLIEKEYYPSRIAQIIGTYPQKVDYHLQKLIQERYVIEKSKSYPRFYRLTPEGKRYLAKISKDIQNISKNKSIGPKPESYVSLSNNLMDALQLGGWDPIDSLHNVRFFVVVDGLYNILDKLKNLMQDWKYHSSNGKFQTVLVLPDCRVIVCVTSGNTVEVMIKSSEEPFPVASDGFTRLASVLGVVRQEIFDIHRGLDISSVDMWMLDSFDRNRDSAMISGKGISVTFRKMEETFRYYFKDTDKDGIGKVRVEKQESSRKRFGEFRDLELNVPAKTLELVSIIQKNVQTITEDQKVMNETQGKMANILSVLAGGNDRKTSLVDSVPKDDSDVGDLYR